MKNISKIALLGVCFASAIALGNCFHCANYLPESRCDRYGCDARIVVLDGRTCTFCGERFFNPRWQGFYQPGVGPWISNSSCGAHYWIPGHWKNTATAFRYQHY